MQVEAGTLSVVMTIVDGGAALRRSLDALMRQQDPPPLEVIVPYDESVSDIETIRLDYANVRFVALGPIDPVHSNASAAGQHELYDRRRAAGLAAARGDLIAILEDRGVPRSDWARTVVRLHRQPYGVIGGAIEFGTGTLLNWAFYACDFGRYGLPIASGPASWVSDVNVSYKRKALVSVRDLWNDRFCEPIVHWALKKRGETLYMSGEMVVDHHRPPVTFAVLLPERFQWGRLFGHIRAMHMTWPARLAYIALWPVLPGLLFARHARTQYRKGHFRRFITAAPAIALLLITWTTGEVWGVVTNRS